VKRSVLCLLLVLLAAPQAATAAPVLVSFDRGGGFAGIQAGLDVGRTGKLVSRGLPLKTARLSPTRLASLRGALVNARFRTLHKAYKPETPIADGYVYSISYSGRAVRIDQGAKLPPRLQRLLSLLRTLTSGA
jgi:hypothetical protein